MSFASGIFGAFIYLFLVPDVQHQVIEHFVKSRSPEWLPKLVTDVSMVAILGFVSWLLIFIFEMHDKIYDRYVIKWRYYYDLDFILPTLTRPFACDMDPQFFFTAQQHMYEFMKPYYDFVGDGERKYPITKNLLVRFYESVTKYWITQINEILLIGAFVLDWVYFFIYRSLQLPIDMVAVWSLTLPVLFFINRIAAAHFRNSVRRSTLDEIEDIQRLYPEQLREAFRDLHSKFNLRWPQ